MPASIVKPSSDVILLPTKTELVVQLKKPSIFGPLAQKREHIPNRVVPLKQEILRMIRVLALFLEEPFVDKLPVTENDVPKKEGAKDIAMRWLKLNQVL